MKDDRKGSGGALIYFGFSVLGGISCAIYGFTANRFQISEIFLLIIGGIVAGIALGLICNGIATSLRK